jgi:Ca2+-binding EF-hand superfamily protein
LDKDEAGKLAEMLGDYRIGTILDSEDLNKIFSEMDPSGDGFVTLDEFTKWYEAKGMYHKHSESLADKSEREHGTTTTKETIENQENELRNMEDALAEEISNAWEKGVCPATGKDYWFNSVTEESTYENPFKDKAEPSTEKSDAHDKVRALFDLVDEDKSGLLDKDEVGKLAAKLGIRLRGIFGGKRKLNAAFAEMDPSGDGFVSYDEFSAWYQRKSKAAKDKSSDNLSDTIASMDERSAPKSRSEQKVNLSSNISKENKEYSTAAEKGSFEAMRQVFKEVDTKKSGLLDIGGVARFAEKLGIKLQDSKLEKAFREMDTSKDACVNFDEFLEWYRKTETKKESVMEKKGESTKTSQTFSLLRKKSVGTENRTGAVEDRQQVRDLKKAEADRLRLHVQDIAEAASKARSTVRKLRSKMSLMRRDTPDHEKRRLEKEIEEAVEMERSLLKAHDEAKCEHETAKSEAAEASRLHDAELVHVQKAEAAKRFHEVKKGEVLMLTEKVRQAKNMCLKMPQSAENRVAKERVEAELQRAFEKRVEAEREVETYRQLSMTRNEQASKALAEAETKAVTLITAKKKSAKEHHGHHTHHSSTSSSSTSLHSSSHHHNHHSSSHHGKHRKHLHHSSADEAVKLALKAAKEDENAARLAMKVIHSEDENAARLAMKVIHSETGRTHAHHHHGHKNTDHTDHHRSSAAALLGLDEAPKAHNHHGKHHGKHHDGDHHSHKHHSTH